MKFGTTLLAKFGLYAQKSDLSALDKTDPFALRLDRISMRETRRQVRQALFRGFAQPLAA